MKVSVILGRFQPFHNGHLKMVQFAQKKFGVPVVLLMINTKDVDERHPFPSSLTQNIYNKIPGIQDVLIVKSADIVSMAQICRDAGYEMTYWLAGPDRFNDYLRQTNKYKEKAGLPDDFELVETVRDGDMGATKVREALKIGDKKAFMEMTPKFLHQYYLTFRQRVL